MGSTSISRRHFVLLSALAGAGLSIDPAEAASIAAASERRQPKPPTLPPRPWPSPLDSAPVLQNPTLDGVTIAIAVSEITTAWVEYGTTPALGERADDSRHGLLPLSGRVHRVRLAGLKPATRYHYRVAVAPIDFKGPYRITRGPAVRSGVHSFTTLDDGSAKSASFSVINDTHENLETLRGVAAVLAANSGAATFWNGDVFNHVQADAQIVANVMRPADSSYAAGVPMCFVSGNHDVRGIHARDLDRFVQTPEGVRHYMMRLGPVAVVVLDTGEDKPDRQGVYAGLGAFERYRESQRRWLEGAIATEAWRGAAFRVGVMHIPLWGKAASEDSRRKWHELLAKGRLDLAIHGHVHEHRYTPPNGEHAYGQLVGGGPAPASATVIRAEADERRMGAIVRDITGKEIGNHEFKRA